MPFDLWVRSNQKPPVFEPERIPLEPFAWHHAALMASRQYAAADRDIVIVEVDERGLPVPTASDAAFAAAQLEGDDRDALSIPTVTDAAGNTSTLPIAVGPIAADASFSAAVAAVLGYVPASISTVDALVAGSPAADDLAAVEAEISLYDRLSTAITDAHLLVDQLLHPKSRESSMVQTKLDEARLWLIQHAMTFEK